MAPVAFLRDDQFVEFAVAAGAMRNGAKMKKGLTVSSKPLKYGGEGEIRTLGTLLTYTRFPIVLLRPARTPLRVGSK